MLIQLRPKAHSSYRSLPVLGPIVDEFSDWAHQCGYEHRSFKSQFGNIRYLANFLHQRGCRSIPELTSLDFDAAWAKLRKKNLNRGMHGAAGAAIPSTGPWLGAGIVQVRHALGSRVEALCGVSATGARVRGAYHRL